MAGVLIGIAAFVLALVLTLGDPVGYDAAWAAAWATDAAHGHAPAYAVLGHPTPHPLQVLLLIPGAVVDGPSGAEVAAQLVTALGLATSVAGAYLVASAIRGPVAGVVAVLVVGTAAEVAEQVVTTGHDLLALGLVLLAVWLWQKAHPDRALVLLALAGLLRPEAWLVAFAVALLAGSGGARRIRLLAVASVAPLIWVLHDLVFLGSPIGSWRHTHDETAAVGISHGLRSVPHAVAHNAYTFLGPGLIGGVLGVAAIWGFLTERRPAAREPRIVAVAGVVAAIALGIAGTPLHLRYMFPLVAMGAIFAAVAIAAGLSRAAARPVVGAVALGALVAVGALGSSGRRHLLTSTSNDWTQLFASYTTLDEAVAQIRERDCGPVGAAASGLTAYVANASDHRLDAVSVGHGENMIAPVTPHARVVTGTDPGSRPEAWRIGPQLNRDWRVVQPCAARSASNRPGERADVTDDAP